MADQYRKLIKIRAGYRGDLTSLLRVIDECLETSLDPSMQVEKDLADFRVVLQDKFEKLKLKDEEIYDAMVNDDNSTESDLVKECISTTEIAIRVQAKISAIDAVLRKASAAFVDSRERSAVPSSTSSIISACDYCQLNHGPENCHVGATWEHTQKASKYFNCLRPGHIAKQCESKEKCMKCNGEHNTSFCLEQANQTKLGKAEETHLAPFESKNADRAEAGL